MRATKRQFQDIQQFEEFLFLNWNFFLAIFSLMLYRNQLPHFNTTQENALRCSLVKKTYSYQALLRFSSGYSAFFQE